jgi:hypothetical protein
MASNTKQTEFRRNLRKKRMGKDRKRVLRAEGSTPAFPLHTPESHANAPAEQLPKADG